MKAHTVYTDDVNEAATYFLGGEENDNRLILFAEGAARIAARRVAWAVAEAYRMDNGMDMTEHLPEWLQWTLEENAPD